MPSRNPAKHIMFPLLLSACSSTAAVQPSANPVAIDCPQPPQEEPTQAVPPDPGLTAAREEPEPDPDQLEPRLVARTDLESRTLEGFAITVLPVDPSASSGDRALTMRVEVSDDEGKLGGFEQRVRTESCGVGLSTRVETVGWSAAGLVVDASVHCGRGEGRFHWRDAHMLVLIDDDARTVTSLGFFEAGGFRFDDERQDHKKMHFHIEGQTVGVYEEHSRWCDPVLHQELHGRRDKSCKLRARTLRLEKRIPLP